MKQTTFGKTAEGTEASLYTICNSKGMRAMVTNFGATLVSVFVKNRNGEDTDVILGYDDVADYQKNTCYFGAVVGRSCNRIAKPALVTDLDSSLQKNLQTKNCLLRFPVRSLLSLPTVRHLTTAY